MTLIPTQSDLRSKLENKQCDDAYELLSKHYEECRTRLHHFQVTDSPSYKCAFNNTQVHWLGALLKAWPNGRKANQVLQFLQKHSNFSINSTLNQLGFDRHEALRVKISLEILTLASRPQTSTEELEELAIRCGEISRCQLCEYGHITSNYTTEEMQFNGCIENTKITEPIFGDCPLFLRRGSIDE